MLVFFIFTGYYSYQTGKLAGVSGFESTTILIFSIIFALLMVFLFIWSIVHLFRLYSGKDKKKVSKKPEEETEMMERPMTRPSSKGVKEVRTNAEVEKFSNLRGARGAPLPQQEIDALDKFVTGA